MRIAWTQDLIAAAVACAMLAIAGLGARMPIGSRDKGHRRQISSMLNAPRSRTRSRP